MPIVEYTASLLVGAGLGEKIAQYKEKRLREAQETLLATLTSGRREDAIFSLDEDAFLSIISRYIKAAEDGAANKNLRLMAQIIRGTLDTGDINPDRCNYLQNIVAEMSEEEIKLVYLLYEANKNFRNPLIKLHRDFVPSQYPSSKMLNAAIVRLCRTGLVNQKVIAGNDDDNPDAVLAEIIYTISPLFDELLALVNLQTFDFVN